jgi:hypothetical protein
MWYNRDIVNNKKGRYRVLKCVKVKPMSNLIISHRLNRIQSNKAINKD